MLDFILFSFSFFFSLLGTDLHLIPGSLKQSGATVEAELQSTFNNFIEFDTKTNKVVDSRKKVIYSLKLTSYKGGIVRLQITEKVFLCHLITVSFILESGETPFFGC